MTLREFTSTSELGDGLDELHRIMTRCASEVPSPEIGTLTRFFLLQMKPASNYEQ